MKITLNFYLGIICLPAHADYMCLRQNVYCIECTLYSYSVYTLIF